MIGICFKYDPGYASLLRDQYYELVKAFPTLTVYERCVPEGEPSTYVTIPINKVDDADDLPTEPTLVIVTSKTAVHIKGTVDLANYVHPTSAIYFTGDDHSHLTQAMIGETTTYDKVYIDIPENVWSSQAMAMVLYDRQLKDGNN